MLHLILLIQSIESAKVVEYRFGYNYGQIFRDFSNNGRHAVNGLSHSNNDEDSLATDRGAYFNEDQQTVTMPKNTYVTTDITLTSPFTVIAWILSHDKDGYIFMRYKSSSEYLSIQREEQSDKLIFRGAVSGQDSNTKSGNNNSFIKSKN